MVVSLTIPFKNFNFTDYAMEVIYLMHWKSFILCTVRCLSYAPIHVINANNNCDAHLMNIPPINNIFPQKQNLFTPESILMHLYMYMIPNMNGDFIYCIHVHASCIYTMLIQYIIHIFVPSMSLTINSVHQLSFQCL